MIKPLKQIGAACGALVVTAGMFWLCLSENYFLMGEVLIYVHLSLILLLFWAFRLTTQSTLLAVAACLGFWFIALCFGRYFTRHVVVDQLFVVATSPSQLDAIFWRNTRGQIHLTNEEEENRDDIIVLDSNGRSLDLLEFRSMLETSLGRSCDVSYRFGYWDFCFRPVGVSVFVKGSERAEK